MYFVNVFEACTILKCPGKLIPFKVWYKNYFCYIYLSGVEMVRKALKVPCMTIVSNAGVDASLVIQKILDSQGNMGYDAMRGEFVDMIDAGIIDPTKVCSSCINFLLHQKML